jgi:hypothetical protein
VTKQAEELTVNPFLVVAERERRWLAVMVLGARRWKEEGKLRCGENWERVGAFILARGRSGG